MVFFFFSKTLSKLIERLPLHQSHLSTGVFESRKESDPSHKKSGVKWTEPKYKTWSVEYERRGQEQFIPSPSLET